MTAATDGAALQKDLAKIDAWLGTRSGRPAESAL